ncbi:MAG TPA: ABC transporter permease subunit [Clostridia bacterium]|nr:ABC transporter permease subunit [Clostridia bacterium]
MQNARLARRIYQHWQLYVFLLLPVVYFAYWPMFGLQLAFKKFTPRLGIWGSPWIGMKNFNKFFASYQFQRVLTNTLRLSFYSILAGFPIPIAFALMLNSMRSQRYKKIIQTVTYMPHFISVVVLVGMVIQIFHPMMGLYGYFYGLFNNGAHPADLMGDSSAFPHLYVWSGIWQTFGWGSIIYMAALASVNMELHEAAEIDGASRFQRVLHVDLPAILPTVTIMLILRAGQVMAVGFEKAFLMQNNLNLRTSEVISTYVYKVGLASATSDFAYSTAIGMFNSVVNMLMIVTVNALSRKLSETSLW